MTSTVCLRCVSPLSGEIAMKTLLRWLSITLCIYVLGGYLAIAQDAYELGEAALQRGDYEEAVQHFAGTEKNEGTLARLGYAYSQLGRYADATGAYQDALHFDTGEEGSLEAQVCSVTSTVRIRLYRLPAR